MEKTYHPKSIEQVTYQDWENNNLFSPNNNKESFCIMLPPPNVTGTLHMGHGFQHTLMDILTRYYRMNGFSTLWQPGTDHAGISTQLVVEKQLEREGVSRKNLTRDEFLEKIWQWKEHSGSQITQQMRRIGTSVDWTRERFTLDDGLSEAVQKVFIELYQEGLIYKGTRLVNWDPSLETAVSDLEVITSEEHGNLWHISYHIKNDLEKIIVATTRPETLLGDVAIAVNPEDPRYQHLIGKKAIVPICNREIPIIADNYVDPSFGSGCVKITPAHDFNDHAVGIRHNLTPINIFTKKAKINNNAPEQYQGLDRFEARKLIISELEKIQALVKTESHISKIPRGEKSNIIIEPLLTEQWYVTTKPLAKLAIDAVKDGRISFVPESWNKTYFQWLENIEDWCISRQLWWGHRIPAWYDTTGNIYVGKNENDVRNKYNIGMSVSLKQDEDVLDTWFSSALWPFSTLGWPDKTAEMKKFYPTDVLVTGFDIIFFWVARMIMMGLKFTNNVPFKKVIITGLIRDADGQKMSKSKGNVLDPIDLIDGISLEALIEKRTQHLLLDSIKEKIIKATTKEFPNGIPAYGTDALRFTYCALATTGRNIIFDIHRLEGYRNFCNKLWNASRFVIICVEKAALDYVDGPYEFSLFDQWINSRLQKIIKDSRYYLEIFRFDLLAQTIHEFVWHDYCDWYLEFAKTIIQDENCSSSLKRGTNHNMIAVLENIVKILHPITPFITENIYQKLNCFTGKSKDSIMISSFPHENLGLYNIEAENKINWLQSLIKNIRNIRNEMNLLPSKKINLYSLATNPEQQRKLETFSNSLKHLAKVDKISFVDKSNIKNCRAILVDNEEYFIPLADLIDPIAEKNRLHKELTKWQNEIDSINQKLNDQNFIQKAPENVIQTQKNRLENALQNYEKIANQYKVCCEILI